MSQKLLAYIIAIVLAALGLSPIHPPERKVNAMKLAWSDEGIGDANTSPNPALWERRITDQWQPAGELQAYTANVANAYYDGTGRLIIKAIKEPMAGKAYSSSRLRSPALWMYGLFEARIKVPNGTGIWPAWWLLGQDNPYGWPYCGEIDIMEAPASAATVNQAHQGTHSPGPNGENIAVGVPFSVGDWAQDYHTYSINWQPGSIEFFIDHKSKGKVTRAMVETAGGLWVFDHRPQSPILNLAVGGWAGTPDPAWSSQTMAIDWVRIYQ